MQCSVPGGSVMIVTSERSLCHPTCRVAFPSPRWISIAAHCLLVSWSSQVETSNGLAARAKRWLQSCGIIFDLDPRSAIRQPLGGDWLHEDSLEHRLVWIRTDIRQTANDGSGTQSATWELVIDNVFTVSLREFCFKILLSKAYLISENYWIATIHNFPMKNGFIKVVGSIRHNQNDIFMFKCYLWTNSRDIGYFSIFMNFSRNDKIGKWFIL